MINSLMGCAASMKHNLVIAQLRKSVPVSKTTYTTLSVYTSLKEMHNNYLYFKIRKRCKDRQGK